ncbi:hypothetical protein Pint_22522 [Pistacia integerrima]|uniref:Uncharacterized protein n=1 Tax=Pistacia integerrima TaxID=434235 RepID=A0ACC0YLW6_9ROSI|nr:hypothetical protein Pint_22522 [Pistacia integerrima]
MQVIKCILPNQRQWNFPAILIRWAKRNISLTLINAGIKMVSFSHQGSCYQVESRARVVIFDIAAFEADSALLRRKSSLLSHSSDQPHTSLSREHGGLMSWPEHLKACQRKLSSLETNRNANSFSAKARDVSIFGGTAGIPSRARSFSSGIGVKLSHNLSYSRVPSHSAYQLPSVRSEGPATARKKLEMRKSTGEIPADTTESHVIDYSSDDSGAEDEFIVRIDSPSRLSFRHAS